MKHTYVAKILPLSFLLLATHERIYPIARPLGAFGAKRHLPCYIIIRYPPPLPPNCSITPS